MRIAVYAKVLSESQPNGIGIYTYNILKAISEIDKKNTYVLYSNEPIVKKIEAVNFSEKILNFPRFWSYLRLPMEFVGGNFDLLFVPMAMVPPLIRPKTVCVFYGFGRKVVRGDSLSLSHRLHMFIAGHYSIKSADGVITISDSARKELVDYYGISPRKITMTHLGYDEMLFRPCLDRGVIEKTKKKYGVSGRYVINTSSLLWHRKNIQRLVRAFGSAKPRLNGVRLLVTGRKGESYEEITCLLKSLNLEQDVILTQYIPDEEMPVLLSGAECMVFPSLYEGFGLSVLEAMACGCPVITSNVTSLPEVVGDAGIKVDPYDEGAIAKAMEKVVGDSALQEKMRRDGIERSRQFSWGRAARQTIEAFEKTFAGR